MDKNVVFKKENDLYKLFFIDGKQELDMGVSFITDHNIEDYPISVRESIAGQICHYKPCKNVVVKLMNPPELTKNIEISKDANLEFNSDLTLEIEKSLVISQNKKTSFFYTPDGEGKNALRAKELEISGNDNIYLYLTNSDVKRSIDDLLLDSMKKQVQKISNNKNILFSLRKDVRAIDICNNISNAIKNKAKVDVIIDSHLVSLNNIDIKLFGSAPTINLSADAVVLEGTNFEVGGVLDITNNGVDTLGGSKLAIANGTISQVMGDVAHSKSSHLTVDCDYLNIHSNVKLKISGNNEIVCQGGRVDFEGGNHSLMESKVIAPKDTELTINTLSMQDDALLEITETKNGKCNIKSVVFSGGQMRDAKGGMIDAVLSNNAKVDNITFGDSSYFWFGTSYFSADKGKYEAKNITLKENASLLVKNNKPDDAYMKIEDVIVSGNCQIDGSLAANIKNSVFNKADIFFTEKQGNIDIVNTIFEGKNSIEGISSIVDSSIENSTIVGNGDKIEAFMMKNIKNFAKALEEKKLAENKDQNNKITTKWEPL